MAKNQVEFNPSVHGEILAQFIKTASDHKAIMESAAEAISDIKKRAKDEIGLKPAAFNFHFSLYHNDKREEFENKNEELLSDYDAVFKK